MSIVTPTYAMGRLLPQCVESVHRQDYPAIEHIVVDGGSTDGTVEFLRSRPGLRWVSEPDGGQSDALNKGMAMASGDLLTWINADDLLNPGAVTMVARAWQAHPAAGLFYGDFCVEGAGMTRRIPAPDHLSVKDFRWSNPIPGIATFFTREAWHAAGGCFDDSLSLAMDVDLWVRMVKAGVSSVHVPEPLATFRLHPRSKSGSLPDADFGMEVSRALAHLGYFREAAATMDRLHWIDAVSVIGGALRRGDLRAARDEARNRARPPYLPPWRPWAFTVVSALSPRVANHLVRFQRHPTLDLEALAESAGDQHG